MIYHSTKTYGHERGLSCAFRQWKANSHCAQLHGYALSIHLDFASFELDERNWVIDFGALDEVKAYLDHMFDHTVLMAEDDPLLDVFVKMNDTKLANVVVVRRTGCEAFAQMVWAWVDQWLTDNGHKPRVWLHKVEVKEHGANGAIFEHTPQGVKYERIGDVCCTTFINPKDRE